jgi:hypothetical protein
LCGCFLAAQLSADGRLDGAAPPKGHIQGHVDGTVQKTLASAAVLGRTAAASTAPAAAAAAAAPAAPAAAPGRASGGLAERGGEAAAAALEGGSESEVERVVSHEQLVGIVRHRLQVGDNVLGDGLLTRLFVALVGDHQVRTLVPLIPPPMDILTL